MLANQSGSSAQASEAAPSTREYQKMPSTPVGEEVANQAEAEKQVKDAMQKVGDAMANPFKGFADAVGNFFNGAQKAKEQQTEATGRVATVVGQYVKNVTGQDYVLNTPGEAFMDSQMKLTGMEKQHGGFSNMTYEQQQRAMSLATARNAAASLIRNGTDPTAEIDDLTSADAQTLRDLGFGTEAQTRYGADVSTSQSKSDRRESRLSSTPEVDTSAVERNQVPLDYGNDTLSK